MDRYKSFFRGIAYAGYCIVSVSYKNMKMTTNERV